MPSALRSSRVLIAVLGLMALAAGSMVAAERSARAMSDAATKFVASLTPEQKAKASFAMESEQLTHWNFIPTEMFPRQGLLIGEMTEAQRTLAHGLMKAGLSQRGYMTATSIMQLEEVLGGIEQAQRTATGRSEGGPNGLRRDPVRYFVSIFGTPSTSNTWGWRVEGHHVSLHFTVVKGRLVASTPTMFGSNPAEVKSGPKQGLRILAAEEDSARELLMSLDATQRGTAVFNTTALNEILTTNKPEVAPLAPAGLAASAMNARQRDLLMKVIDVYAGFMADDIAAERLAALKKAGLEKISFAWAGAAERGQKHYYRIQGPTFLIEYDNAQNDANHIHSVWRDFNGDFGRDLLREHLAANAH
jgi:hypothetical protein